jgi:antitoxin StbD
MARTILVPTVADLSELKKDPVATVAAGEGLPVAIVSRNRPAFYCVPAALFEAIFERIEDLELTILADGREGQQPHKVTLDEL